MTPETRPPEPWSTPSWQSLFPYAASDVQPLEEWISHVSSGQLISFVRLRRGITASNVLTGLSCERLPEWHASEDRGGDEAAEMEYNGGLLYGVDFAEKLYFHQTGEPLVADDDIARQAALVTVKSSYGVSALADVAVEPWQIECRREYRHTGSLLLAASMIHLDAHFQTQMKEMYTERHMGDGVIDPVERVAFYRGMLDGLIYYNSYASWKLHGHAPLLATELDPFLIYPLPQGTLEQVTPKEKDFTI